MPVTRQVGFEVEGVPPSPAQEATLAEQHLKDQSFTSGSPTPVTIPPTFQSTMDGMRTVSLPVEAAATSLPDSALAQAQKGSPLGDASAVGHTSIDLSRLEVSMVNQGQSHTASATTGAAPPGGEGTTRGGVRRGSVASSAVSSANPTPVREGALAAMASDGAVAHDGLNSGQQSPHPLRNTDGSGIFSAGYGRASTGQRTPPQTPPGARSPVTRHPNFGSVAGRIHSADSFHNTQVTQQGGGEHQHPGEQRRPSGEYRRTSLEARSSGDHARLTEDFRRASVGAVGGQPAPPQHENSAQLAAIAAAAAAGAAAKGAAAAAKGRSPAVTPPSGASPALTPTSSNVSQEMSALLAQQQLHQLQHEDSAGSQLPPLPQLRSPRPRQTSAASPLQPHQHQQQPHQSSPQQQRQDELPPAVGAFGSVQGTEAQSSALQQASRPSPQPQPAQPPSQQQQQQQSSQTSSQQQQQQQQQQGAGRRAAREYREPPERPERLQLTKAQRREQQEAQRAKKEAERAAKLGGKGQAGGGKGGAGAGKATPAPSSDNHSFADAPARRANDAGEAGRPPPAGDVRRGSNEKGLAGGKAGRLGKAGAREGDLAAMHSVQLFSHLQQFQAVSVEGVMANSEVAAQVHPAVLQLGLRYADGSVRGASARCVAMLVAFRTLVQDYVTPEGKVLSRDLTAVLNTSIQFLVECRPLSAGMGNAIKYLKTQVSKLDIGMAEPAAKAMVADLIDNYIQEKIVFAGDVLVRNAVVKLKDQDVILTYAFSSVVLAVLLKAFEEGLRFRVVVVDARPGLEGRELLRRLLAAGISATYVHINSLAYVMPEITQVLLGASSVNSNGTVMSRIGSAAVAMAADAAGVAVIICCETFKFVAKVQLDSITANELGDPAALATVRGRPDLARLGAWQEQPDLALLNLMYDAMPAEYVSVIITEFGAIPPTSVPVILKEYLLDISM